MNNDEIAKLATDWLYWANPREQLVSDDFESGFKQGFAIATARYAQVEKFLRDLAARSKDPSLVHSISMLLDNIEP